MPPYLVVERLFLTADGTADGAAVIKGVSFNIRPGELVVIVGATGAGKSVLARIVAGAVAPTSGEVRLGGASRDRWPAEQWGKSIGYVPEDASFFPGSVAANIARFDRISDLAGVYEATRQAGVHEMILRLPAGYQTNIGDGSTMLSAGQRQQIALARAFYGNPKLFVLDHPTAHLDQAGEGQLLNALTEARKRGATILVMSRRNTLLNIADRAFSMQDGMIEPLPLQQRQPAQPEQRRAPAASGGLADMAAKMSGPPLFARTSK